MHTANNDVYNEAAIKNAEKRTERWKSEKQREEIRKQPTSEFYSENTSAAGTGKETGTFGTVKHSEQRYGNRQTDCRSGSEFYHSRFHYICKECIYEYSGCLV